MADEKTMQHYRDRMFKRAGGNWSQARSDMRYQRSHNIDPEAGERKAAAQSEFSKSERASEQATGFPKIDHHLNGKKINKAPY